MISIKQIVIYILSSLEMIRFLPCILRFPIYSNNTLFYLHMLSIYLLVLSFLSFLCPVFLDLIVNKYHVSYSIWDIWSFNIMQMNIAGIDHDCPHNYNFSFAVSGFLAINSHTFPTVWCASQVFLIFFLFLQVIWNWMKLLFILQICKACLKLHFLPHQE